MVRSICWSSILSLAALACASTPGARPHDMSAAQHDREAGAHAGMAKAHAKEYDPNASVQIQPTRCNTIPLDRGVGACWTSIQNPTETHLRQADEHSRHAADHRAASAALREAEARACVGISPEDRDMSPFERVEDIAIVEPLRERTGNYKAPRVRTTGAVVTFRALPGMTAEWLQRTIDCHLARNAALGHVAPEMPSCPLVPNGVEAQVSSTGNGFAVTIRSDDSKTADEILSRAQRLGNQKP